MVLNLKFLVNMPSLFQYESMTITKEQEMNQINKVKHVFSQLLIG